MDISARAISLADRPHRAKRVTSVRMRRENQSSISSRPLADLGGLEVRVTLSRAHWAVAGIFLDSKFRPWARTLQAMRANLLASAIARTLWCSRLLAASTQGLSPWRSQLFGLMSTTHAAWTNKTRR